MYICGVELNVEITGEGTPFIWAYGLMSSIEAENASGFEGDCCPEHIQLMRYDARGHGKSQPSYKEEDYHWSNLSQDMLAIANAIGAEQFIAGGGSLGWQRSPTAMQTVSYPLGWIRPNPR